AAPFPVLLVMTVLPLLGALVVWKLPSLLWSKRSAYLFAIAGVVLGMLLLHWFDTARSGIQLGEQFAVAGMHYTAGVDASNVLFLPLVPILTLLCLIYLRLTPYKNSPRFLACVLAYSGIMTGAFAALNLLQFWFWCLLELLPLL